MGIRSERTGEIGVGFGEPVQEFLGDWVIYRSEKGFAPVIDLL